MWNDKLVPGRCVALSELPVVFKIADFSVNFGSGASLKPKPVTPNDAKPSDNEPFRYPGLIFWNAISNIVDEIGAPKVAASDINEMSL